MNLSGHAFNTNFMSTRLLKEEFVLVFLSIKFNISPSSTTIELHGIDVELMNTILQRQPCNVTLIMYSSTLQCMAQAQECIQHPRAAKLVLILPSLIVKICLNHKVDCIESFTDTIVRRSMSGDRSNYHHLTSKNNSLSNQQE